MFSMMSDYFPMNWFWAAECASTRDRNVVLESRTWTRVRLELRFLRLGLETCGLGFGLATYGLGLGLDTSGLEIWTSHIRTWTWFSRYFYIYDFSLISSVAAADRKCGPRCVRGWEPTRRISGSHPSRENASVTLGTNSDNYFWFAATTVENGGEGPD